MIKLLITFVLFICVSFHGYCQDSIKIYKRVDPAIKIWPDTGSFFARWYAEESYGILIAFPSIDIHKVLRIMDHYVVEKNGNAIITKDTVIRNVYWVYPIASKSVDTEHSSLELEFWVRFNHKNIFCPVSKNGNGLFLENEDMISSGNVNWKELGYIAASKDGYFMVGAVSFVVNPKR